MRNLGRNLLKMLSGLLTPVAIAVGLAAAAGCVFLAFRCPPLIPVVAVVTFLFLCWWDTRRKNG